MPKTLLLADDSITIQKVVGITFANEDFEIISVDNGEDAVKKAGEIKPDIILADVVMPKLDGYQVCEKIKSNPDLQGIPVLLLTGAFKAFDEERSRQVGADGHIAKPFDSQALIDKVQDLITQAENRPAPFLSAPPPVQAPAAPKPQAPPRPMASAPGTAVPVFAPDPKPAAVPPPAAPPFAQPFAAPPPSPFQPAPTMAPPPSPSPFAAPHADPFSTPVETRPIAAPRPPAFTIEPTSPAGGFSPFAAPSPTPAFSQPTIQPAPPIKPVAPVAPAPAPTPFPSASPFGDPFSTPREVPKAPTPPPVVTAAPVIPPAPKPAASPAVDPFGTPFFSEADFGFPEVESKPAPIAAPPFAPPPAPAAPAPKPPAPSFFPEPVQAETFSFEPIAPVATKPAVPTLTPEAPKPMEISMFDGMTPEALQLSVGGPSPEENIWAQPILLNQPKSTPPPISAPLITPPPAAEAPVQTKPAFEKPAEPMKAASLPSKIEAKITQTLGNNLPDLTRETIERIAWEIIPDLAESIIREEIERLKRDKGIFK